MEFKDELKDLVKRQKIILNDLEGLERSYNKDGTFIENERLKKEIKNCKEEIRTLNEKFSGLTNENERLKVSLKEQMLSEKLDIIKISRNRMKAYFLQISNREINRLDALEQDLFSKMNNLKTTLEKEHIEQGQVLEYEVEKLKAQILEAIVENKRKVNNQSERVNEYVNNQYSRLENEGIDEKTFRRRVKENDVEIKIGLGWINKIGVALILLGAATAVKYSYSNWFNNYIRGLFIFILGILFVVSGEWFSRKSKDVFSIGLNAGGTAILYYGVFSSYFFLKILDIRIALILSVIVTIISTVFSLRYNSRTIISYALIGGYLPFFSYVFSFGLDQTGVYGAMIYLFMLNSSLLIIAFYKRWNFVNYLSFVLNVPVLIYLILRGNNEFINIIYAAVTFGIYAAITLMYPLKNKINLRLEDSILLSINTTLSCIVIYYLFEKTGLGDMKGVLALAFCALYYALGRFTDRLIESDKKASLLFYITSLTFAILVVPFQFGEVWLSLAWGIEATLLVIFGLIKRVKIMEMGGWILFGIFSFILFIDLVTYKEAFSRFNEIDIQIRYLFYIAEMIVILVVYVKEYGNKELFSEQSNRQVIDSLDVFKLFLFIYILIYAVHDIRWLYDNLLYKFYLGRYYSLIIFAAVSMVLAYAVIRISAIYTKLVRLFSIAIYIIVDLLCVYINSSITVLYNNDGKGLQGLAVILLIIYNILIILNIRRIVVDFISRERYSLEMYPIVIAIILFLNTSIFLNVQVRWQNIGFIISLVYMLLAFSFIAYGLKYSYSNIRRLGLALAVFSNAKLFIYDLSGLTMLGRIAAYFSFGFVMLGISYIYQRIKKSM